MSAAVDIHRIFSALGDSTRRALVERLSLGPQSVSQLAEPLHISLAAVVQHLQVLEDSGIVTTEKLGRVRHCKIQVDTLSAAENWLSERRLCWQTKLDRLGEILDEDE